MITAVCGTKHVCCGSDAGYRLFDISAEHDEMFAGCSFKIAADAGLSRHHVSASLLKPQLCRMHSKPSSLVVDLLEPARAESGCVQGSAVLASRVWVA